MPRVPAKERIHHFPVPDPVVIRLAPRVEARVKRGGYLGRVDDADRLRQSRIDGADDRRRIDVPRKGHARDLPSRMHPGVGAARARDRDVASVENGQRFFETP